MARKRIEFNANLDRGPMRGSFRGEKNTLTMDEFLSFYLEFYKVKQLEDLSERTLEGYRKNFDYIKQYFYMPSRFSENREGVEAENREGDYTIDVNWNRNFTSYMLFEKQYQSTTVNIRLRTLKTFYIWLYKEGRIGPSLYRSIKILKVPDDLQFPLKKQQIKKLISIPDKNTYNGYRDYVSMLLILDTGIRVNELVNIKVEDVTTRLAILKVRGAVAKTRRFRELPLSEETIKGLKPLLKAAKDNGSEFLFMNELGERLSSKTVTWNFRKYGKKANIQERCTPHVLRHTFATNFVRKGGDIFTLQRIMGHSTIITTRKYIQLDVEDLRRNHRKIGILDEYL